MTSPMPDHVAAWSWATGREVQEGRFVRDYESGELESVPDDWRYPEDVELAWGYFFDEGRTWSSMGDVPESDSAQYLQDMLDGLLAKGWRMEFEPTAIDDRFFVDVRLWQFESPSITASGPTLAAALTAACLKAKGEQG